MSIHNDTELITAKPGRENANCSPSALTTRYSRIKKVEKRQAENDESQTDPEVTYGYYF